MKIYTTAPAELDSVWTKTVETKAGITCGQLVRLVDAAELDKQRQTYHAAGYSAYEPETWRDLCQRGLAFSYEVDE